MAAQLRKLGFCVALLMWIAYTTPALHAYSAGYCYCYREDSGDRNAAAYIYEYAWTYLDEDYAYELSFYGGYHDASPPGPGNLCWETCVAYVRSMAENLCNTYGDENHHVQMQTWIHWEDLTDPQSNWTAAYNAGQFTPLMCSSL